MLEIEAPSGVRSFDGPTRRELLRAGALGLGGLTLPGLLRLQQAAAAGPARKPARAKSVIVLFLNGGPSQLDMWDPKPQAPEEVRGTFKPIATSVPGVQLGEHLPRMARLADKYVILRALHHTSGNHPTAAYWMMIGSPMGRAAPPGVTLSREDRPHPGSAAAKLLGPHRPGVPAFVLAPEPIGPLGIDRPGQHAGFLGPAHDPYRVSSDPNLPDYSPGNFMPDPGVSGDRLAGRRALLERLDQQSRRLEREATARSLDPYYARAYDLVSSTAAQKAFDVAAEPDKVRDRYGRHAFGQSALLARRLVEAGVRLVQVNWVRHDSGKGGQGYDSHRDHLEWCKNELLPPTDAAFAALVEDLSDRGLLGETLVVVLGEFGRTPKFNVNGGRDHWPWCFSAVLAGGGLRGGQVFGSSDRNAAYPSANPVTPQDLTATLYHALGIDPHQTIHDQQNRPFTLAEGKPLEVLF